MPSPAQVGCASGLHSGIGQQSNLPERGIFSCQCLVCLIDQPFRKSRGHGQDIWRGCVLPLTSSSLHVDRASSQLRFTRMGVVSVDFLCREPAHASTTATHKNGSRKARKPQRQHSQGHDGRLQENADSFS